MIYLLCFYDICELSCVLTCPGISRGKWLTTFSCALIILCLFSTVSHPMGYLLVDTIYSPLFTVVLYLTVVLVKDH